MTREAQIAITASIVLHILILLALAGVKLYRDESIAAEVPIAFIYERKTTLLRRSPPVRSRISLHHSTQRHSLAEQHAIYPERASSVEFYVSAPESVFSRARSIESADFQSNGLKRPSIRGQKSFLIPKGAGISNETYIRGIQIKPRILDGRDLVRDIVPARSDTKIVDDVLQRFLSVVRKKIESKKEYPLAAQRLEIEGRTRVRMTILKDGELEEVRVVESSGHEILDSAALRSVQKAAPFPPIPEAAKLDRVEVSIYLVFKLS